MATLGFNVANALHLFVFFCSLPIQNSSNLLVLCLSGVVEVKCKLHLHEITCTYCICCAIHHYTDQSYLFSKHFSEAGCSPRHSCLCKANLLSSKRTYYVWILLIILKQIETGRKTGIWTWRTWRVSISKPWFWLVCGYCRHLNSNCIFGIILSLSRWYVANNSLDQQKASLYSLYWVNLVCIVLLASAIGYSGEISWLICIWCKGKARCLWSRTEPNILKINYVTRHRNARCKYMCLTQINFSIFCVQIIGSSFHLHRLQCSLKMILGNELNMLLLAASSFWCSCYNQQ